jgi:surface protein
MFQNCYSLTNLDLSVFNTIKVTNIDFMFSDCYNLKTLNLENFNTLSCNNFNNSFDNCTNLEVKLNPKYCENLYPYIPDYVNISNVTKY